MKRTTGFTTLLVATLIGGCDTSDNTVQDQAAAAGAGYGDNNGNGNAYGYGHGHSVGFGKGSGNWTDASVSLDLPAWAMVNQPVIAEIANGLPGNPEISVIAPAGATYDADTGVLIWTPSADQIGEHTVTVHATDGSQSVDIDYTIVVSGVTILASATISASEGGALEVTDPNSPLFGARLEFPPNALAQDTPVSIGLPDIQPEDISGSRVGKVVELLPSGIGFQAPVTLTLPYDEAQALAAGYTEDGLVINQHNPMKLFSHDGINRPASWTLAGSSVDTTANTVSAPLQHFSLYEITFINLLGDEILVTDHFEIRFTSDYDSDDKVMSDFRYGDPALEEGQPARRDDIPNYIEDLAWAFEKAWNYYNDNGYEVSGFPFRYTVVVKDLGGEDGHTKGRGYFYNIAINTEFGTDDQATIQERVRMTAAHELFHMVQNDAINTDVIWPVNMLIGAALANYQAWAYSMRWFKEMTATFAQFEVIEHNPVVPTDHYWPILLTNKWAAIDEPFGGNSRGYSSFAFLSFLKAHYPQSNVLWRMFNQADPDIGDMGLDSALEYWHWRMEAWFPADLYHHFGIGYQYLRRSSWVDGMSTWPAVVPVQAFSPTGDETDASPAEVPNALGAGGEIAPGGVMTFPIDFSQALASHGAAPEDVQVTLDAAIQSDVEGKLWTLNPALDNPVATLLVDGLSASTTLTLDQIPAGHVAVATFNKALDSEGEFQTQLAVSFACVPEATRACVVDFSDGVETCQADGTWSDVCEPVAPQQCAGLLNPNPADLCAYECEIDLSTGSHNCGSAISVDSYSGGMARMTVNMGGFTSLQLDVDACSPTGHWLNVADSPTCNGGGGDSGTSSNDAELHSYNGTLGLFGNDYMYYDLGTKNIYVDSGFTTAGCWERTFILSDQRFQLGDPECVVQTSPYALRLNPPTDNEGTPDAIWYIGLNQVVGGTYRSGTGVQSAKICLR